MRTRFLGPIAWFMTLAIAATAQAHSGGTDANGCHAGTQPYHCHSGGSSSGGSSGGSDRRRPSTPRAPIGSQDGDTLIMPGQGSRSGANTSGDRAIPTAPRTAAPASNQYPVGIIQEIIDGDTMRLSLGSTVETVRLACIDAPEISQAPYGGDAAERLSQLLGATRQLTYRPVDRDRYGRMVAEVYLNGNSLNVALVQAGAAVVYPQYLTGCPESRPALLAAQQEAQAEGRGFWAQPQPIMPWEFRR